MERDVRLLKNMTHSRFQDVEGNVELAKGIDELVKRVTDLESPDNIKR